MSIRNIFLSLFLILFNSCATTNAPGGWLPDTDQIQREAYGGWMNLLVRDSLTQKKGFAEYGGEFVSSDEKHVYLISDSLFNISKEKIFYADLEIDAKNTSEYTGWTCLGTLSTISNGLFLIITAPVWVVSGISVSAGESIRDRYRMEEPDQEYWDNVQKFARFPQGISSINLYKIRSPKITSDEKKP